jgi:cytochrome P450
MKKIRSLVQNAIDKKKTLLMNGAQPSGDLLESLLLVHDETTGETIPESLIIDEALTFLAAGHGLYFFAFVTIYIL